MKRVEKADACDLLGSDRWKKLSKARLAYIAYNLASLCNAAGSCDDHKSTLDRIDEEDRILMSGGQQ